MFQQNGLSNWVCQGATATALTADKASCSFNRKQQGAFPSTSPHVDTHVSCLVNPNQVQRVWPPLASIGLWMSTYGCIIALSLFAFVPLSIMHFCPRYIVVSMMTVSHAVYFMCLFMNMLACRAAAVFQFLLSPVSDMQYSESLCTSDSEWHRQLHLSQSCQAWYSCIYPLQHWTSNLLVLLMVLCRQLSRSRARWDQ